MPARQLWVGSDVRRNFCIDLVDMSVDLIQTMFVSPLEKGNREVFRVILDRDLIADQAIAGADQFGEPCLFWRSYVCPLALFLNGRSQQDGLTHQASLLRCRCRPSVAKNFPSFPLFYSCHPGPKPSFPSRPVGKQRGNHTDRRSSMTETTSIGPLPPDPGWPTRIGHLMMPQQAKSHKTRRPFI